VATSGPEIAVRWCPPARLGRCFTTKPFVDFRSAEWLREHTGTRRVSTSRQRLLTAADRSFTWF
jgi:hypothetical protein